MLVSSAILQQAEGVPDAIQFVDTTDRQAVYELIRLPDYVDLVIPRGSNEFVQFLMKKSDVPVLGHADGICHIYVDKAADTRNGKQNLYECKGWIQSRRL